MRLLEDSAASSPSLGSPQARAPYQGSPRQETGLLPLHHPAWPKHPRDTKVGLPRLPFLPVPPCPDPRNQARGPPYKLPQCQHLPLRQLPPHQSRQRRGQRLVGFSLWAQPQAALCAEAPGSQFRGVSREQGFRHSREPVNPAHSVSCRWGEGVCVHD